MVNVSVTKQGTGNFLISFTAHPSGTAYGVMITSRGGTSTLTPQIFKYSNLLSTSVTVYTNNSSSGAVEDPQEFTMHTIP